MGWNTSTPAAPTDLPSKLPFNSKAPAAMSLDEPLQQNKQLLTIPHKAIIFADIIVILIINNFPILSK